MYLEDEDCEIQDGAIYALLGIGKYGAGDFPVLSDILFGTGKILKLNNPADTKTATIKRTATGLEIDSDGNNTIFKDTEENPVVIENNAGDKSFKMYKTDTEAILLNEYDIFTIDGETRVGFKVNGTEKLYNDVDGVHALDEVHIHGGQQITLYSAADAEEGYIYRDATAINYDSGSDGYHIFKIDGSSVLVLEDDALYPFVTLGLDLGSGLNIFKDTYSEDYYQFDVRWMNPPLDGALVTNTSAAWTTISSKVVPANEAWMMKAFVIGYDTGATVAAFEIVGTFKVVGGVATAVGTPGGTILISHEDAPATTDCQILGTAGATVDLQVKGTNNNMKWTVNWDITRVPIYT